MLAINNNNNFIIIITIIIFTSYELQPSGREDWN